MKLIEVINSPWAIIPEMLIEIRDIYLTHLRGEKIDIKKIEAKLGEPLGRKEQGYEVVNGSAIIPIDGPIAKRMNLFSRVSGGASTELIARDIRDALDDPAVEQIILHIDSPGGTVDGTEQLADLVYESRDKKKIIAYTDGTMASAAYWIGSAASEIYISGDTVQVGSIGVVATHVDISKAEEMRGIKTTEITAGRYKRIASRYAPLSEEGRADIQEKLDYLYSVFVNAVAEFRGVSPEAVIENMADGKIFIGRQAIDAGLVDDIATLDQLVNRSPAGGVSAGRKIAMGGVPIENTKKEVSDMTVEELKEKHPDVYKSVYDDGHNVGFLEGKEAGIEEGRNEGIAKGRQEGAENERERIRAVREQLVPGCESLIEELMFDGKTTGEQAAVRVLDAIRNRQARILEDLKSDAPKAVPHSEPPGEGEENASDTAKRDKLIENYQKEHGVSYREALVVVSRKHPELFKERR